MNILGIKHKIFWSMVIGHIRPDRHVIVQCTLLNDFMKIIHRFVVLLKKLTFPLRQSISSTAYPSPST